MRPTLALSGLATAVALVATAGCAGLGGAPALTMTVDEDTAEWGEAVQVTLRNVGEGDQPAPVDLRVVSTNGTTVRTFEDVTGGRGIAPGGQVTVAWNGLNDEDRPVLWGNYSVQAMNGQHRGTVEILPPDNYAITVDPEPRETEAGSPMTFVVENNGTVWLNGTLDVLAGKDETVLYNTSASVRLAPGEAYEFHWRGKDPDGEDPEPDKYLVGARLELDREDGPTPFAQDVFTLTEPGGTG
jgi:hypothetical protein